MLDKQMLMAMPPHTIFAVGTAKNEPGKLHMIGKWKGRLLKWAAISGFGPGDWAIYCHWEGPTHGWVCNFGEKVGADEHIRRLVPCDDEALALYRR